MKLKVEFTGGLELIFKTKTLEVLIDKETATVQDVIQALKPKILERPDFFLTKNDEV